MTYKAASQNDNKAYTHAEHPQTMLDGGWCQRAGLLFLFIFSGDESPYFTPVLGEYMELDDAVLAHVYGEVGDSAACALWEGFLLCVRVLSRSRTARESFNQTCAVTCHRPSTTHPSPPPTAPWKSAGGIC